MKIKSLLFSLPFLAGISMSVEAQKPLQLVVKADKPTVEVAPTMWGIFFEDINFAADGGIYAELVKNRSFEFATPIMGWDILPEKEPAGQVLIINDAKNNAANPRYARISRDNAEGDFSLVNEGFRGVGIEKDKSYNFSILGRKNGSSTLGVKVSLVDEKGAEIGSADIPAFSDSWSKQTAVIVAKQTAGKGKLQISFSGKGAVDVDMISLFPKDTWMGRPNGLRKDLVQKLADLKPGFIRFPGGCIVEGRDLANRYQWKKTVGATENRQLIINRWNTEFKHKSAPDYFQSFGLGFYEYFQLAEDIGAAPLPILNCGMACQFNTGEVVSMDELDPFIQDALDLIEFANAPVTTKWGKLRAEMGHPKPFNLTMMGVGNEQWDRQYIERYKVFEKTLKAKHPEIKLVSGAGPYSGGDWFDYAWKELKTTKVDFIDEHYYSPPQWFLKNAGRYDTYDRKGPKVFAGEYAAHTKEDSVSESRNNWLSALAEGAFMTGLERNADVVRMASYAPLFAHVDAWQWRPDLIWFDNLKSTASPNYYVQKLFSAHRGNQVVPVLNGGNVLAGKDSVYASATVDKAGKQVFIKIINVSGKKQPVNFSLEGISGKGGSMETVRSDDLKTYNSLEKPNAITPSNKKITSKAKTLQLTLDSYSANVIILPLIQ